MSVTTAMDNIGNSKLNFYGNIETHGSKLMKNTILQNRLLRNFLLHVFVKSANASQDFYNAYD